VVGGWWLVVVETRLIASVQWLVVGGVSDSKQQTTNNKQQTTNNKQQTTNNNNYSLVFKRWL
jgi:hypothetical protein